MSINRGSAVQLKKWLILFSDKTVVIFMLRSRTIVLSSMKCISQVAMNQKNNGIKTSPSSINYMLRSLALIELLCFLKKRFSSISGGLSLGCITRLQKEYFISLWSTFSATDFLKRLNVEDRSFRLL